MSGRLSDDDEILFRQIHPDFLIDGVPASNRFKPSNKDEGMMSVDRGALTTAAESHSLYVNQGLKSAAVFGLAVGELGDEGIDVYDDPISKDSSEGILANPAHALADYNSCSEAKWKVISKRLKRAAIARGKLHP